MVWSDEVSAAGLQWARTRLDELGVRVTGPAEQVRATAWSVVHAIPTAAGRVWFKGNGGEDLYEAGLAAALAAWAPRFVLAPLAADVERSWLLLPDGGTPLRELDANRDLRVWERFVASYADLQREVTPYAEQMLALRVPDHRPESMPGLFEALVDDLTVDIADGKRAALRALKAEYADACARLAEAGPAPTIQHDDLHSNNVLPSADGDRFFDWGDSSVAHPFATLLVALRTMAYTFDLQPHDAAVLRFRDAYLEPWGLGREGRELAELAAWTGMVGRSLSWRRGLVTASPTELAEYGDRVGGWLEELLQPR